MKNLKLILGYIVFFMFITTVVAFTVGEPTRIDTDIKDLDDGKKLEIKKDNLSIVYKDQSEDIIFNITSDTKHNFLTTKEWAYEKAGSEFLRSKKDLVIKGDYVCNKNDFVIKNLQYYDEKVYTNCVYYVPQYEKQLVWIPDEKGRDLIQVLEDVNIRNISLVDSKTARIDFSDNYDPEISNFTEGLVSCWSLDELTDNYASNHLSLPGSNPPTYDTSEYKLGNASYLWDGTDNGLYASDSAGLRFGTGSFTISAWVLFDITAPDTNPAFIGKGDTGAGEWMFRMGSKLDGSTDLYGDNGNLRTNSDGNQNVSNGSWHMVTIHRNDTDTRIYINSIMSTSGDFSDGSDLNTNKILEIGIADSSSSRQWKGNIDEVVIWNTALNSSQILALYNSSNGVTCETLIASGEGGGAPPGDTIAPLFTEQPDNITQYNTTAVWIDFNATDETAFSMFYINDTQFIIGSADGILINNTILPFGNHTVKVSANDTSNNINNTYLTVEINSSYIPDTTAPNCSLISVFPADIEANTTGVFEMIVNCTDVSGMNTTKVGVHHYSFFTMTVDSNGSTPNYWQIFYPNNNLAVSNGYAQQVFRAVGRNESYWYEDIGQPELDANIHDYAVYDGEYGHFKIQDNGSDYVTFNISGQVEHLVFKQAFPLNLESMQKEIKSEYIVDKDDGLMVLFYDLERIKGSVNYTLTAFGNFNYTGGLPSKDFLIYYCNQSYLDLECNGDFLDPEDCTKPHQADNCVFLNSMPSVALTERAFTEKNSSYISDTYGVINGEIGGIVTTNISYIFYRSRTTGDSYTIRYADGVSSTNTSFNQSGLAYYTSNDGKDYLELEGTPDIFINTRVSGDQFQLGGCVWDLAGNEYCNYKFYTDDIGAVDFPISKPNVDSYQNFENTNTSYHENEDEYLNNTYNNIMTIHINIAIDPNSVGNVTHNLTLRNTDGTFNYTINGSFKSVDDSDIHIVFDTNNVPNGLYKMNITAIAGDNLLDIQSSLTYNNFTIDNIAPTWDEYPDNITIEVNITSIRTEFNATDDMEISQYFINDTTDFNITTSDGILTNKTLLELGTYIINVSVNDTGRNINSTYFQITVQDTVAPTWDEIPTNLSIYNSTAVSVDFNATDNYRLDQYYINDTGRFTIDNITGMLVNDSILSIGNYTVEVSINDTTNNINTTLFQIEILDGVVLDIIPPTWDEIPDNLSHFNSTQISVDFNASDNILVSQYFINDTTRFNMTTGSGLLINNTILPVGNYTINVSVNDTSNNINSTLFQVEILDSTTPDTIAPVFNTIRNFTHPANSSFSQSITATDNIAISTYFLNDTSDFTVDGSGLITNVSALSSFRLFNFNLSVNDTSGNINSTFFFINVTNEAYKNMTIWQDARDSSNIVSLAWLDLIGKFFVNRLQILSFKKSHVGGQAYVCVDNNGDFFTSEAGC